MVGHLVGLSIGWFVGRLVGRLVGRPVDRSVSRSVSRMIVGLSYGRAEIRIKARRWKPNYKNRQRERHGNTYIERSTREDLVESAIPPHTSLLRPIPI